ncbi:hypothetical protein KIW84_023716 [Lathyrus oleraceus]|uniref:Uncharacterized protein n=1 Tax=Pisum sativum TaxID=3888 RepID=A0A9D4YDN6_PEA|nr:hypothetical protein KIW84_023716 [Pisum sativum]
MIIVSYNIRGGGSLVKKRRIWHTLISSKADVCLIQESKFIDVDSSKICSLWYNNGISWSSSVSSGHSAGLIILWNSSSFKLLASVKVGSFLEICLDWKGIVELVEGITEGVYNYFNKMFKKPDCSRPTLEGIDFKSLSPAQSRLFEEPFSKVEIKAAAWDCDGKKSTGPDAFNLEFIKRCWYILKSDVLGFFQEFHSNDVLPKSFISYFLTLIPNNKNHTIWLGDQSLINRYPEIFQSSIVKDGIIDDVGEWIETAGPGILRKIYLKQPLI